MSESGARGVVEFRIDERQDDGRLTIAPAGELDVMTVPELERRVRELPPAVQELVIDLREVSFIDSSGIRALLLASESCRQQDVELSVMQGAGQVAQVMRITQLGNALRIVDADASAAG